MSHDQRFFKSLDDLLDHLTLMGWARVGQGIYRKQRKGSLYQAVLGSTGRGYTLDREIVA